MISATTQFQNSFPCKNQLHGEEKSKTQQNVAFAATSSPLENNQKSKSWEGFLVSIESLIFQSMHTRVPSLQFHETELSNPQSNPKPRLQVIETLLKVHTKNMQLAQIASCSKLAKDAHKNMQLAQIARCSKLAKDAHKNMQLTQIASHSKLAKGAHKEYATSMDCK